VARGDSGLRGQLSVGDDLSKWPARAAEAVVAGLIDRDRAAAGSPEAERTAVALAHCAYRRVIRTRRQDHRGVLPKRRHVPLVAEPLGAEVDRQSLMWQYFGHLEQLSSRFDPVLMAKRVVL